MKNVALLVIDVQKGLDDPRMGVRNNPDAESNIELLLAHWRKVNKPVVHVQHCSLEPDSPLREGLPGNEFKPQALPLPEEKQFKKSVNSAFIGTGLETYLHENKIQYLVVVGLTTDHCVSTSVRMAGNLGFDVTLVSDATATHGRFGINGDQYSGDEIHNINLASLNGEFCQVKTTNEVLAVDSD